MTEEQLYQLADQIERRREEYQALSAAQREAERGTPAHADLARRRMEAEEALGHLVFDYLEGEEEAFVPYSEVLEEDLGTLSSMAQLLVQVRAEMEKELARDDLTPYMWSLLNARVEGINVVLGILGGKKSRSVPLDTVPTHVLYAEYSDDSIDFAEADDEEEAERIRQHFIDEGAVVYRYRVMPETGERYPLTEPITPMTNRHRPMTGNKFRRVIRLKGGEDKFRIPEVIRDALVLPYDTYHERDDD